MLIFDLVVCLFLKKKIGKDSVRVCFLRFDVDLESFDLVWIFCLDELSL